MPLVKWRFICSVLLKTACQRESSFVIVKSLPMMRASSVAEMRMLSMHISVVSSRTRFGDWSRTLWGFSFPSLSFNLQSSGSLTI
jgi:hypothetical protein